MLESMNRKLTTIFIALIASVLMQACASTQVSTAGDGSLPDYVPGETLLGTPLREPAWSPAVRARLIEDLEIARAQFDVAPDREDSYIWLGRRLGYLARWQAAIDVFTRGIEKFPDSYKLYRFRGRHLARNRQLHDAIRDYRRAAEFIEDRQDSFEPDGIINSRHQYLGTYKSNIHYYLAQTSYAVGDYETTVAGMRRALAEPLGQSPDRLVSSSYWLYLGLRKLGRDAEAEALVANIPEGLDIIENHTYYQGVQFFNGSRSAAELLPRADGLVKFAIAMDHHFAGRQEEAATMWRQIVEASAQGFWPAEAELLMAKTTGGD